MLGAWRLALGAWRLALGAWRLGFSPRPGAGPAAWWRPAPGLRGPVPRLGEPRAGDLGAGAGGPGQAIVGGVRWGSGGGGGSWGFWASDVSAAKVDAS